MPVRRAKRLTDRSFGFVTTGILTIYLYMDATRAHTHATIHATHSRRALTRRTSQFPAGVGKLRAGEELTLTGVYPLPTVKGPTKEACTGLDSPFNLPPRPRPGTRRRLR